MHNFYEHNAHIYVENIKIKIDDFLFGFLVSSGSFFGLFFLAFFRIFSLNDIKKYKKTKQLKAVTD